jgi:hypothetical protein
MPLRPGEEVKTGSAGRGLVNQHQVEVTRREGQQPGRRAVGHLHRKLFSQQQFINLGKEMGLVADNKKARLLGLLAFPAVK